MGGGLIVLLLSLVLIIESIGFGATPQPRRSSQRASRDAQVVEIFLRDCARCHGGDGRGETPLGEMYKAPDFTDDEWWRQNAKLTTVSYMRSIVTNGKGDMPAFGKKLKRSEISSLVNYVRRFREPATTTNQQ